MASPVLQECVDNQNSDYQLANDLQRVSHSSKLVVRLILSNGKA